MPTPLDVRLMNVAALVLALGAGAVALGNIAMWALRHPAFAISRLAVQGDTSHYNALTLSANVGTRISGNFFTVDLAQARAVFESIPWVRRATVRREFPNRLRITLEEHQSAGFWGADSESVMVNSFGEVFEANPGDAQAQELPRLIGGENQSNEVLAMYRLLSSKLQPMGSQVDVVELSSRGAWRMQLDGGAEFELGRGNAAEVSARLDQFLTTHQKVLTSYQRSSLDSVESVDLRHAGGYSIRMRGVSTISSGNGEKK